VLRPVRPDRIRPRWLVAGVVTTLAGLVLAAPSAAAAPAPSVALKVLVVDRAAAGVFDTTTQGVVAELAREGVPYDLVPLATANAFTKDSLEDVANQRARYQGVVLADPYELSVGARELIEDVEKRYGLRQVNTNVPGGAQGMAASSFTGRLDGAPVTVTAAGKAGVFGYLAGSFQIDDADPAVDEVFGNVVPGLAGQAAGDTYTSLLDISVGTAKGSLASVYTGAGREQLSLTAAGSDDQQWLRVVAPGVVSWVTRGVSLGFHRNYFAVHIDDVFLPDSRWSDEGKCTPGDGCTNAKITTDPIRMTPTDVTRLVDVTTRSGLPVDLAFNGSGSVTQAQESGRDTLLSAFVRAGVGDRFRWINHTYTHTFLGCIQVAPTVSGQAWSCATPATTSGLEDVSLATDATSDGTTLWLSPARITGDVRSNIDWATTVKLPNVDKGLLVTGEHSGLTTLPQQPLDNPNLAGVLTAQRIAVTGSDASREADSRLVGGAQTLPRHPMNVFYNAGTYQDEVSEYNWIYAPAPAGTCINSSVTTCMAGPLAAADNVAAKASFERHILPIEIKNALRAVLAGDPRPFYAHQSNLAEDGILYPVLTGILDGYAKIYDTKVSRLVNTDMREQVKALGRAAASSAATAYVDATGVHVTAVAGAQVPLTVPAASTGSLVSGFTSYDGNLSGWVTPGAGALVATLNPVGAGYLVAAPAPPAPPAPPAAPAAPAAPAGAGGSTSTVPDAPTLGAVTGGNRRLQVGWTAPGQDGGSPISSYIVRVYVGSATTPVTTLAAAAGATGTTVPGLAKGTGYTVDVVAVNAVGTGPASARSAMVTPTAPGSAPARVTGVSVGRGNRAVKVRWAAPADGGSRVTSYVVRVYLGTSAKVAASRTVPTSTRGATVTRLRNGTRYTVDVRAVNAAGTGAASVRSRVVVPATTPGAPVVTGTTAGTPGGRSTATVRWRAPRTDGGAAVVAYRVVALRVSAPGRFLGRTTLVVHSGKARSLRLRLRIGTYRFTVQAVNAVGPGTTSAASRRTAAR
jgi:hypothetical protein